MPKYYAVAKGVECGVFTSWDEAKKLVDGYSGAEHKSFATRREAEEYIMSNGGCLPPGSGSKSSGSSVARSPSSKSSGSKSSGSSVVRVPRSESSSRVPRSESSSRVPRSESSSRVPRPESSSSRVPRSESYGSGRSVDKYSEKTSSQSTNRSEKPWRETRRETRGEPWGETGGALRTRSYSTKPRAVRPSRTVLEVYTDGSSILQTHGTNAGYGFVFVSNNEILDTGCGKIISEERKHNDVAEMMAVEKALQFIDDGSIDHSPFDTIVVKSDSAYVVDSFDKFVKRWRRNGWKLKEGGPVKNLELVKSIDRLATKYGVQFEHVKAHSGIEYNEIADQLAREGRLSHCDLPSTSKSTHPEDSRSDNSDSDRSNDSDSDNSDRE